MNVLVVGYPKSGNTWLTRLVAELLDCPVGGFWNQPDNLEIAIEGKDRKSNFTVYKGHHTFEKIKQDIDINYIIYIVRDIRDVVCSSINFFESLQFIPKNEIETLIGEIPKIRKAYSNIVGMKSRSIDAMIRTASDGDVSISPWFSTPWDKHIESFRDAGTLIIKYEDLLLSPESECIKILSHVDCPRSNRDIRKAIKNQSFAVKKREFSENGQASKANFMRSGKSGNWHSYLSKEQALRIENRFEEIMRSLEYIH